MMSLIGTDAVIGNMKHENKSMSTKNNKGFTLGEMLITVAIIGVLVSISVPMFTNLFENQREAKDVSSLRLQYEQVMGKALMGKESVNVNGADFGKIKLEQRKDGWQDLAAAQQIKELTPDAYLYMDSVKGEGYAWISYRKNGTVHINFGDSETDTEGVGQVADPVSEELNPELAPLPDEEGETPGGGTEPDDGGSLEYKTPGIGDVPINTEKVYDDENMRPSKGETWVISVPDTIKSKIALTVIVHNGNHGHGSENKEEHYLKIFYKDKYADSFEIRDVKNGSISIILNKGAISQEEFDQITISKK